jgi:transposase
VRLKGIAPERLVYLDETGAKTNMLRLYARAKRGLRSEDFAPHGHWHTTTLVAALTLHGPVAPMVLDGPMDRVSFEAYVDQVLAPSLWPGAIVVMDNLAAHKSTAISERLAQDGIEAWYLPPYSPDYNPIEMMWAKVKAALRSANARTQELLEQEIAEALANVSIQECRNYFQHSFVCMQH